MRPGDARRVEADHTDSAEHEAPDQPQGKAIAPKAAHRHRPVFSVARQIVSRGKLARPLSPFQAERSVSRSAS
jgi:hypothetical protein